MKTEQDILNCIAADDWMMEVLQTVRKLQLPDWWIGAGLVRNKVWDVLHDFERTPLKDIDVIYFNKEDITEESEKLIEQRLHSLMTSVPWSVKNQARMHFYKNDAPYSSSVDALTHWVETATAVAVQIDDEGRLRLAAPFGISDLLSLRVVPTPAMHAHPKMYNERQHQKNWQALWPKLHIEYL